MIKTFEQFGANPTIPEIEDVLSLVVDILDEMNFTNHYEGITFEPGEYYIRRELNADSPDPVTSSRVECVIYARRKMEAMNLLEKIEEIEPRILMLGFSKSKTVKYGYSGALTIIYKLDKDPTEKVAIVIYDQ